MVPFHRPRAGETVLLGSTMDGDKLVFHPKQPDNLFFLPRDDDQLHQVGPGLDAAIDWFCDSGVLTARSSRCSYFEPTGDRERIAKSIACPYEVVRDAVLDLRIHDHVAFEECSEDEEEIYDIQVNVGGNTYDVENESSAIMLLIQDIGGDVMVSRGSLLHPHLTDVSISYVADQKSMKLERLLGLLGELEARAGKPKRRR